MTKNVHFHDIVMFLLKMSPEFTVSVLVYSFSLRSLVFKRSLSETLTGTCPTVFTGIYLTCVISGLDCDKTAQFEMFKNIYLKVLYRRKSVMKTGSILKPRYIRFRVISGLQRTLPSMHFSGSCAVMMGNHGCLKDVICWIAQLGNVFISF